LSDLLRKRAHGFNQRAGAFGDWLRDHGIRIRILTFFKRFWVACVYVFLFAPLLVIAVASLNGGSTRYANIAFPPTHISLDWYLNTPVAHIRAFGTSIVLGVLSSVVALLLALPASLGLVRSHVRGRELVAVLFRVPLQIPFVIVGISFLSLYYALDARSGLTVANTFVGLAVAHVFILMPYIINSVTEVLRRFNTQLEEAALVHGASQWHTFFRVTLPVIAPGVFAGTVYAFMVSFSDVPIALFLASPSFTPLPMLIYQSMEVEFDATLLSTSTAVIIVGLGSLLLVQKFIGLGSLLRSDASALG
jgi:putative spermidine/putrescine transport system permease protein